MPRAARSRFTVVGLGGVGQSLALALGASLPDTEIVGHDRDPDVARAAKQSGAVGQTHWNLISACEGASLVILALPTPECLATLEALKPELSPGTVVTDTAPLKQPLVRWAAAHMPAGVHFVGGHPLARPAQPNGEAFRGSIYCITPPADAEPAAVATVSQLAETVGAKPAYLDPVEHDGLIWRLQGASAVAAAAAAALLTEAPGSVDAGWLSQAASGDASRLAKLGEDLLAALAEAEDWGRARAALTELRDALTAAIQGLDDGSLDAAALAEQWRARRGAAAAPPPDPSAQDPQSQGTSTWRRMLGMR